MGEWTRRGFLKALGIGGATAVAGVATLDPEKLLWVPGAKTIFIPKSPALYRGELVTDPKEVAETLRYLSGNMLGPGGARYHMTLSNGTTHGTDLFFDDQWRLMQAVDAGRIVKLTEDKAKEYAALAGIHPEQRSPVTMSLKRSHQGPITGFDLKEQSGWNTHDARYHMEQVSLDEGQLTDRQPRDRTWDDYWTDQKRIASIRDEDLEEKQVAEARESGMTEIVRPNGMVEWVPSDSPEGLLKAYRESSTREGGSDVEKRLRAMGFELPSWAPDVSD